MAVVLAVVLGGLLITTATSTAPPSMQVAELQSNTVVPPTRGGLVWVVGTGMATFNVSTGDWEALPSVLLADATGVSVPATSQLRIEHSVNDSLLLVNVGHSLPAHPLRLKLERRSEGASASGVAETALSPLLNTAEPHWVSPFGRPGDRSFLVGRRFWAGSEGSVEVLLAGHSSSQTTPGWVESDSRVSFTIPADAAPGQYVVSYQDAWGIWNQTASGAAADLILTVLPALPVGKTINVCEPPYSADATGQVDATSVITAAVHSAGNGGTVLLCNGTFVLNEVLPTSSASCKGSGAALCLPWGLRATLAGAGQNATIIKQGAKVQAAVWGSSLSLRDLTLTDELLPGHQPDVGSVYKVVGMWSMDQWAAWQYNVTDVYFRRVHFVCTRNRAAINLRYARRIVVDDCRIDGGAVQLEAPVYDIQITRNVARLHGPFPKQLGGGVMGFIMTGMGGRITAVSVANNTITRLKSQEESTISGRIWQSLSADQNIYIANNYNLQAGPGDLCEQNQGEQFLWENGANDDPSVKVEQVDGHRLTLKVLSNTTLAFLLSKVSDPLTVSPVVDPSDGMMARDWGVGPTGAQEYGRGFGGVFILAGRGVGQSRRVLGLLADHRTLLLDRSWGVEPDVDSVVVLFSESAHSVTIRDNTMIGIAKHVDQTAHTASTMIPLWGRADRFLYSGNTGTDMRTTMYSMVATNLTVVDHAIVNTTSIHTRLGLELSFTPSATKLTNLWTIDGTRLRNVVGAAISVLPHCYKYPDCTGAPAGAVAISNISVSDAAVGVAIYHNGWTEGAPSSFNWTGPGLGALVMRNFTFDTGAWDRLSQFLMVVYY